MGVLSRGVARRLTALPMLLLLASCGGGGGGGGGGSSTSPVVYAGNTGPAVVTEANAAALSANVVGGGDTATTILGVSGVVTQGDDATHVRGSGVMRLARRINRGLRDSVLRMKDTPQALAGVQIDETEPCDSGVGSVRRSGTLNDTTYIGTLMVSFNGCLAGADTLNGSATLRIDEFSFAFPQGIPSDSTLSFARFTIRGPGVSVDAGGSLRLLLDFAGNTETVTANLVALDHGTGRMTKAENLVLVNAYDSIFSPSAYMETMTGRVFDSVHGFVDVATTESLVFATLAQLFPNPGQLVLAGAANRGIRITATSATQVGLELDLDGDNSFELWTTILWTEVSGAAVVDFVRPTAPVVSVAVNADRSVTISWTPSSDGSGIREYRVLRGTMPIARTAAISFTDRSVEPGSTADYFVRAVDNAGNLSDLILPQSIEIPSGGTATFASPIVGTLPFAPTTALGVGVADVNGDSTRDLIVPGGSGVQTALGPLTTGVSFVTSSVTFDFMSGDRNQVFFNIANISGDSLPELLGNLDTLVWNASSSLWESGPPTTHQCGNCLFSALIDLNDDGFLDIVGVTADFSPKLVGMLGTGNGSYDGSSLRELAGIKNYPWDLLRGGPILAADIDRNGLADLVVWDAATIRVVRQTGRGVFAVTASLPAITSQGFRANLLVADVTGDGYPDIIFADYSSDPDVLRVYVNDGAGGFSTTAVSSGISRPWNFSAGDINSDGIPDLVVGNRLTNALDLYVSQGDGTFTLASSIAGAGFPSIALVDVDLDGDIDIVVVPSSGSTDVRIHLHQ